MAKAVTVDFNANLARFSSNVDKAINDLNRFQSNTSRISASINKTIAGFGIGIGVNMFVDLVKNSIDAADRLNDLNKTTGISIKTLAGLDLAARQSGGDLESIAASINKLSVNIGNSGDKFKKLGIDAKDPFEAFKQLADVFNSIEDPQLRAAFGAEALGKSWQGAAPLLSEGSVKIQQMVDKGERLSKITKENAKQADEFNDRIEELKERSSGYGLVVGTTVIPYLEKLLDTFDRGTSKAATFTEQLKALATFGPTGFLISKAFAGGNVNEPTGSQTASGKIKKSAQTLAEEGKAQNAINKNVCEFNGGVWDGKNCNPKPSKTGTGGKDDPTKRLLDNRLKEFEAGISRESALLSSRNRFIELYNNQNLISIEAYYSAKNNSQQENLQKSLALYDKEIAALQAFQKTANKVDSADAQGKINALLQKKDDMQRDSAEQAVANNVEQAKALEDYRNSLLALDAEILQLTGNLREAAAIRFDQQNEQLSRRLSAEANTAGLEKLKNLRSIAVAQAEANGLEEKAALIQQDLINKEQRIDLARKLGSISELGALRAIDDARSQASDRLKVLVDNYEEVAIASGNPKLIQNADDLKLKLEELVASSEQLADRFSKIFEDSAASAFEDFISGTKSAGDAFASFADDVVRQINKIVAQNLAQSIFGGISGSGLGDLFGGIFGGLFGGTSGGNASPGIKLPKFAEGTDYVPHDMIAVIHKGEKITPAKFNNKNTGMQVTNNFILPSAVDSRSQQQIANSAYQGIMKAARRNS